NLHVFQNVATLSLDASGESLHKRGYRPVLTKATLNEALAAGLILRSGWDVNTPFVDPMCGSGTLPIEAAWIALRRRPGWTRRRSGSRGWPVLDVALGPPIRAGARRGVWKALPGPVLGFDVRRDVVDFAKTNARAAGIGNLLTFEACDVNEFRPPEGP